VDLGGSVCDFSRFGDFPWFVGGICRWEGSLWFYEGLCCADLSLAVTNQQSLIMFTYRFKVDLVPPCGTLASAGLCSRQSQPQHIIKIYCTLLSITSRDEPFHVHLSNSEKMPWGTKRLSTSIRSCILCVQ